MALGKVLGLAAGAAAAGAAAVGVAADRAAAGRRRLSALDADGFAHTPTTELTVVAGDGVVLHVEIDEPGDPVEGAPTIVLTHGFALTSQSWVLQRRELIRAGYRVVVWDQRSHGRSERSDAEHISIEQLGRDLADVIEHACPDGPLVLVGHSMGGMTVMAFARLAPQVVHDRVIAVALIATSAGGPGLTDVGLGPLVGRAIGKAGPRVLSRLAPHQGWLAPVRRVGRALEDAVVDYYSFDSPVSEDLVRFASEMVMSTPLDVMADFITAINAHDEHDALAAFADTDALVIVGDTDRLTPAAHSEAIVAALQHADHVVVAGAGHLVTLEHPEVVSSHLLDLIGAAPTAQGAAPKSARSTQRTRRVVTDIAKKHKVTSQAKSTARRRTTVRKRHTGSA